MRSPVPGARNGFTLVELMTVVAIVSVIAVLAVVSYGKYTRRAVSSEAIAMLGEIRIKEEAYLAEAGNYLSTGADETAVTPALDLGGHGYKARPWGTHTADGWANLGINPPRSQLYCGYVAIASGAPSGTPLNYGAPASGTAGRILMTNTPGLGANTILTPWFYARACCDLQTPHVTGATCPSSGADVTVYSVVFNDTTMREENPGQ